MRYAHKTIRIIPDGEGEILVKIEFTNRTNSQRDYEIIGRFGDAIEKAELPK